MDRSPAPHAVSQYLQTPDAVVCWLERKNVPHRLSSLVDGDFRVGRGEWTFQEVQPYWRKCVTIRGWALRIHSPASLPVHVRLPELACRGGVPAMLLS